MADVGGNSSGRSHERYIPSYDAPTAPIPAIPAEDGSIISPRVPRRFPIGDGEETVLVPRPKFTGSFPPPPSSPSPSNRTGLPSSGPPSSGPPPSGPPPFGPPSFGRADPPPQGEFGPSPQGEARGTEAGGPSSGLLTRVGDIPIRAIYSLGAAVLTAVVVVLIFVLFSGDEPAGQEGVRQAEAPAAAPSPAVPPIRLPALPRMTIMRVLPGAPSPVLGAVTDVKAAITYSKLGTPWAVKAVPPFSVGQQVGSARLPRTTVASSLLPGATPATALKSDADYRKAALAAVKWTIRNHHPAGSKVVWTASQKPATGRGWMLGYRVTYEVKGKKRTSQAALALLDIGRRKPAMFFVTVPDTRKQLWADIAPLMTSVRAL